MSAIQISLPFTSRINVAFSDDGKSVELLNSIRYYRKIQTNKIETNKDSMCSKEVIIPQGFISDGITSFGLSFIVPRFGRGLKCVILHDYLCTLFHKGKISRKLCDEIFLEALLETKALSKTKAYFMYFCVRIYAKYKGYE